MDLVLIGRTALSETIHILSRSLVIRLSHRIALTLLVLLGMAVTCLGVARADGDPASDVLATQTTFVPADAGITAGELARLERVVAAAGQRGYPIRVALISSATDLGSVTALWRQPQNYAQFLWQELSFAVHGRVLVAMPSGLGLYDGRRPTAGEQAVLAGSRPAGSGNGLATAAAATVQSLAAAAGHPLPPTITAVGESRRMGSAAANTVAWIVLIVGAALIAIAWGASLRARPLRPLRRGARSV